MAVEREVRAHFHSLAIPRDHRGIVYVSNTERATEKAREAPNGLNPDTDQTSPSWRSGNPGRLAAVSRALCQWPARVLAIAGLPALLLAAGCGGGLASTSSSNSTFSVSPGTASIDTNCTGCNNTNSSGTPIEQFTATLKSGGAASVSWAVSPSTGAGTITSSGQYTPPSYLTANSVQATITATLNSGSSSGTTSSAAITVTPGFLQPLSPENLALGGNGSVTITGYIAEVGGTTGINYSVSNTSTGSSGGQGSVGTPSCTRNANSFTYCSATYTAPGSISADSATYVVATVGTSSSKVYSEVLLNAAGITSNPGDHQTQESTPIALGTSGGNNNDYDTQTQTGLTSISDCCGGTLGSLIQNSSGTQYLLSNNHVLARSDQAATGEMIIQPGLIDDGCNPNGDNGTETPVGSLTSWLPLSAATTNVDAAIAQVNSGAVNTSGAIQELGNLHDGALAAAPPGTSSTGGKGESGTIGMVVAKSGRTTGLTCAGISAINATVEVDYFKDCAETQPYLTKTYTNQIEIEGNQFSDAGDSGSLVVDTSNAEPVGLFFAGGVSTSGSSEGIANPAPTVLSELGTQQNTTYTFVGTTDHPVSCLNYGAGTATAAQSRTLTSAQAEVAQKALAQARMLVNPAAGILGTAVGKSSDRAGEPAVILYVDKAMNVVAPQVIDGIRTEVISTNTQAVAAGTAPQYPLESGAPHPLAANVLTQAIAAKKEIEQSLVKQNPAFFGIGVGQSLDDPNQAALVIYVDRKHVPASLPATINGLRTRYIVMDRLHVTRAYLTGPVRGQGHCMSHPIAGQSTEPFDPLHSHQLRGLNLF
jgi:hypothetical protein